MDANGLIWRTLYFIWRQSRVQPKKFEYSCWHEGKFHFSKKQKTVSSSNLKNRAQIIWSSLSQGILAFWERFFKLWKMLLKMVWFGGPYISSGSSLGSSWRSVNTGFMLTSREIPFCRKMEFPPHVSMKPVFKLLQLDPKPPPDEILPVPEWQ